MIETRVAALVLAKDYFLVRDPLAELKGETIEADRLPRYKAILQEAVLEFQDADKKVKGQLTPGLSNPRAGEYGRDLQRARRKGTRARARVEVAEWMRKHHYSVLEVSEQASGEFLVLKNPHEGSLQGETIVADKLKEYEKASEKAKEAYAAQKAKNQELTGRARGQGGQELARLGAVLRHAQAKVEVARQLKKRGLKSIKY